MTINVHFTDYCNFSCKHCFIKKEQCELTKEEISGILNNIYDYSIKNNLKIRINIAGGEPFCSINLQYIIDYAHSLGFDVSLITNGYYLNEEFILLNKNKLSMIGISIDSICDETNIKIGRICGHKTLDILKIVKLSNLMKKYNIKFKVNVCINEHNVNEDLTPVIEELKPDRLKILRVFPQNATTNPITDNQWISNIMKYSKLNPVFEDNDIMATEYYIVDSKGNLSKDNMHLTNNSLLDNTFEYCFSSLAKGEVKL